MIDYNKYLLFCMLQNYVMMILAVFVHQMVLRALAKQKQYPLRLLFVRILEIAGKTFIIPGVFIYFLVSFDYGTKAFRESIITILVTICSIILFRELAGFKGDISKGIAGIEKKIEAIKTDKDYENISIHAAEIIVLNLYYFKKFSMDLKMYNANIQNINAYKLERRSSMNDRLFGDDMELSTLPPLQKN